MTDTNSVERLFEGKTPELRGTFDHLVAELRKFGEIKVSPEQTSIHLEKNSGFAGYTRVALTLIWNLERITG